MVLDETTLIIVVCTVCILVIFINSEWFQSQIASRFYPFEIENKTEENLQYRYVNPKTKEPMSGTLLPGQKHTNKNLNAFQIFKVEVKRSDPELQNNDWQARQVGRDARRVSIVASVDKLERKLRSSVLRPLEPSSSK